MKIRATPKNLIPIPMPVPAAIPALPPPFPSHLNYPPPPGPHPRPLNTSTRAAPVQGQLHGHSGRQAALAQPGGPQPHHRATAGDVRGRLLQGASCGGQGQGHARSCSCARRAGFLAHTHGVQIATLSGGETCSHARSCRSLVPYPPPSAPPLAACPPTCNRRHQLI
jgi:hypothetical protein